MATCTVNLTYKEARDLIDDSADIDSPTYYTRDHREVSEKVEQYFKDEYSNLKCYTKITSVPKGTSGFNFKVYVQVEVTSSPKCPIGVDVRKALGLR